jgi:hypothetical protein
MPSRPQRSPQRTGLAVVACLALSAACESSAPTTAKATTPKTRPAPVATSLPAAPAPPRFMPAPSELDAVEPFIQEQTGLALAAGARALVYVGAPWCEPCQRFHAAITRGELDGVLAGTRFIEFDAEHHNAALHRAGYAYELIPVIAIPNPDGRSSGRLLSGSIKGPAAVASDLVPRLRALLAGREVD